mmetsp:Transcript_6962/g.18933  ORF Transcript_6962/g.18933 Transcript_6962/m.18933 type:complete len:277 (-) Transcript_6962:877-1707(-)
MRMVRSRCRALSGAAEAPLESSAVIWWPKAVRSSQPSTMPSKSASRWRKGKGDWKKTTSTSERSTEAPTLRKSRRIRNLRPEVAWLLVSPVRVRRGRKKAGTPRSSTNSAVSWSRATTMALGTRASARASRKRPRLSKMFLLETAARTSLFDPTLRSASQSGSRRPPSSPQLVGKGSFVPWRRWSTRGAAPGSPVVAAGGTARGSHRRLEPVCTTGRAASSGFQAHWLRAGPLLARGGFFVSSHTRITSPSRTRRDESSQHTGAPLVACTPFTLRM